MKTLITLMITFFICIPVHAVIIPTETIGTAYNDGWWFPSQSTNIGPGARGGTAIGSALPDGYHVSFIDSFIKGVGDGFGRVEMALIRGSALDRDTGLLKPGGEAIYTSAGFDVPLDGSVSTHRQFIDMNLPADDYWLAYKGTAPVGWMEAKGSQFNGEKFASIHNPEPATALLLGGGLLAAFRRRRDATKV